MKYFQTKIKMAANVEVEDFEYVTQFFGFTPKSFVDGVYNAINDYIQECFKEMGKVLDEEFANKDEILRSEIRDGCKTLIAKCYRNVDASMDKMELYMLRNIFIIPPEVLLPEDQVHKGEDSSNTDDSELSEAINIDKEIVELQNNIRKEILFDQMLRDEQEKIQKILNDLKRLEQWFDNVCNEIHQKSLKEIINSACTNSLEIKDILQTQKQLEI